MKTTLNHVAKFVKAEEASAATEYAIMLGLIALAAVGAIGSLGQTVSGFFSYLGASLPA